MGRYFGVLLRGAAMGAADVVPGVSGGTIAFITGIYDELIDSIKAINIFAAGTLFKEGPRAFWQHINGNFLISLLAGIALSILSLAHGISYVLDYYPTQTSAFFFGLVAASSWLVYRQMPKRSLKIFWLVLGVVCAIGIGEIRPVHIEVTPLAVFLSGFLAICAMILPGISGSFILLLLGMYQPILAAVKSADILTVIIFAAGCGTGLLVFVRLLSFLLHRYRESILSWLIGILVGSLSIIWPWKQSIGDKIGNLKVQNVLPWDNASDSGLQIAICVILALISVAVVLVLESLSDKKVNASS